MPEREALRFDLEAGWQVLVAGVTRERDGTLRADAILQNGRPVCGRRLTLSAPEDRDAFAHEATDSGRPNVATIVGVLLELYLQALALVQEPAAKPAQSAELVALAADAALFHTPDGTVYATVPVDTHYEHLPLGSRGFRDWLARRFYREHGKAPGGQALQDALNVLAGQARYEGPECPVYVRLAEDEGTIYLDLGNALWEAVAIAPDLPGGWQIVANPPVKFRRAKGLAALPYPVAGGAVADLRPFLNCGTDDDWTLLVAWLLAALCPRGPFPVLALHGEQGSAKSTTARVLRALTDPSTTPLRTSPREERELAIQGNNSWVLAFDNLSRFPDWFSDALCRLSTGGGLAARALYTDDEETLFTLTRPVLLNGIEDLATRGDLLDRTIVRVLPAIPPERRRTEADFWRDFEKQQPALLGALLTVVSGALARLPGVRLARTPRLADFASWVTAAEPGLGWEAGTFLRAYEGNRAEANDLALDASPVTLAVRTLAADLGDGRVWRGTATDLLAALAGHVNEGVTKGREWPKTARALGGTLRRYAPNLRAAGVMVEHSREAHTRRRLVLIRTEVVATVPTVPTDPTVPQPDQDGHACRQEAVEWTRTTPGSPVASPWGH